MTGNYTVICGSLFLMIRARLIWTLYTVTGRLTLTCQVNDLARVRVRAYIYMCNGPGVKSIGPLLGFGVPKALLSEVLRQTWPGNEDDGSETCSLHPRSASGHTDFHARFGTRTRAQPQQWHRSVYIHLSLCGEETDLKFSKLKIPWQYRVIGRLPWKYHIYGCVLH